MDTSLLSVTRYDPRTNEQSLSASEIDISGWPMSGGFQSGPPGMWEMLRRHGRRGVAILGMVLLAGLGWKIVDPQLDLSPTWRGSCFIADALCITVLAVVAIFVRQDHAKNSQKAGDLSSDVADDQSRPRSNGITT